MAFFLFLSRGWEVACCSSMYIYNIARIKVNGYGAGFISWPFPLHRVQHHQQTDMRLSGNMQVGTRHLKPSLLMSEVMIAIMEVMYSLFLTLMVSNHQPLKLPVSVAPRTRNIANGKMGGDCTVQVSYIPAPRPTKDKEKR